MNREVKIMAENAEIIDWENVFDIFFRDCFNHWKRNGDSILVAYDKALNETKMLRNNPFMPKGQEVDREALSKWEEKYTPALNDLYKAEAKGVLDDDHIRFCDHCGLPMFDGYYLAGEFACSDRCALALYDGDEVQMKEDLSHANEDDGECYWTEWESIRIY